jgi:hypothetical protein
MAGTFQSACGPGPSASAPLALNPTTSLQSGSAGRAQLDQDVVAERAEIQQKLDDHSGIIRPFPIMMLGLKVRL